MDSLQLEDLRFLLDNNIIKLGRVQMRTMVEQVKRDTILRNYENAIYLSGDGRWHTYFTYEGKRQHIAKSTREKVEDAIVQFYKKQEKQKQCTLATLYPIWLDYKATCTATSNTVKRIDNDWNKYYMNTDIIDIPLERLDYITLNSWANNIVSSYGMTRKQYGNMSIIMRQGLEYAVEKELIKESPFGRVKVAGRLFQKTVKKESETQVYMTDEQPLIEAEAFWQSEETGSSVPLAIPLCFQTGLRVGELVALKKSDIKGDYLYVQRSEVRVPKKLKNGWGKTTYEVVDHTKTEAGTRRIYLTAKAREILHMIDEKNQENGFVKEDYLFMTKNGRIHARALDHRLRRYCKNSGIPVKSMHKIRKTFISTLIDNNVNINQIREIVGHESEQTTYQSYCYNRHTQSETERQLEEAL